MFSFLLLFFHLTHTQASVVTPELVRSSEVENFSFLFANSYYKQRRPLGVDLNFEVQATFNDNPLESKNQNSNLDSSYLTSFLTIRKGLYWNIDASLSFLTPLNKNVQNGFQFSISHTWNKENFVYRNSIYLLGYNINETLNQRGFGWTSIFIVKALPFMDIAFGAGFEDLSSEVFVINQESESFTAFETRAVGSLIFPLSKKQLLSLDGSYIDVKNYQVSLSYSLDI